jgi:hypothetical protein
MHSEAKRKLNYRYGSVGIIYGGRFMKQTVQMFSDGTIHMPSSIMIGSGI